MAGADRGGAPGVLEKEPPPPTQTAAVRRSSRGMSAKRWCLELEMLPGAAAEENDVVAEAASAIAIAAGAGRSRRRAWLL